eukprot:GAHX01002872.1.p1 GENE.GAHX01002872.1~~GAHX01002872.1.p1  ORF type:complete len:79 (-),score=9.28 GAHX01002872.1:59-295(-)
MNECPQLTEGAKFKSFLDFKVILDEYQTRTRTKLITINSKLWTTILDKDTYKPDMRITDRVGFGRKKDPKSLKILNKS